MKQLKIDNPEMYKKLKSVETFRKEGTPTT